MSYTYDLTATGGDLRISEVRLLIGDNDGATNYEMEDAELTYFLTQRGNVVKAAAADACDALARKYAKLPTFSADGLSVHHGERAQQYAAMAKQLRAEIAGGMTSVTLTRSDGYSEEAADSEYESRTIYVKV